MKWQKILVVMVVCMLMMGMTMAVYAETGKAVGIQPRYTYTWSVEAGLQISDSGVAQCQGGIGVYDESSTISFKVSLYEKVDGSWERVTSWYDSCTGRDHLNISRTYQLTEYGRYKVLVTGTVTGADGGSEWISLESDQRTY